jgi:hypothetical protein
MNHYLHIFLPLIIFYMLLGVDPGYHCVPLHRINSKLDFASGQAAVRIRYMLPDEDSPLLFGID